MVQEFNKLLERKYNINIIKENDEYYYKLTDIYNITMSDIAKSYCKEYNKNIFYKQNGCRYLNKEGLIFILCHSENGLKEEFLKYNLLFKYDNELYFNQEALELIKKYPNNIVYTVEKEQILFRAMDVVENLLNNNSINMTYIRKYFENYLYKIKYRKTLYINMEGIKILQFIDKNDFKSISFLKEYNPYYEYDLFKDPIFKNTKRFIKDKIIYYKLKDLSNHINSFGSVSTIINKYITEYEPFDNLEEYYINQKQVIEFIEKANTIKSINLCIKYKLDNQIVNELKLEEYIKFEEITMSNKKIRTFTCDSKHILFCLQDLYKILGYENCNLFTSYEIHIKNFRNFITLQELKKLLEIKINNTEYVLRSSNIFDIIYLSYQLELNMNINNKSIFSKFVDEDGIKYIKDEVVYFSNLLNSDNFSPTFTKNIRFIIYDKNTYIIVEDNLEDIFQNTKDRFGDKFKFVIIKNKDNINMLKVIEFDSFIYYISRMKKVQAVKIRDDFGINERYTPILENATLPIIESSFPNLNFERQYIVKYGDLSTNMYHLDMALPEFKIYIECDEDDHKTYNITNELKRADYLNKSGWVQLRYNPMKPETIGKVIYDIMMILKDNTKI